jgi:hypothetical protein
LIASISNALQPGVDAAMATLTTNLETGIAAAVAAIGSRLSSVASTGLASTAYTQLASADSSVTAAVSASAASGLAANRTTVYAETKVTGAGTEANVGVAPNNGGVYGRDPTNGTLVVGGNPIVMESFVVSAKSAADLPGRFLGTSLTASQFFSAAGRGAISNLSIVGSATYNVGQAGGTVSLNQPLDTLFDGGTPSINGQYTVRPDNVRLSLSAGIRGTVWQSGQPTNQTLNVGVTVAPLSFQVNFGTGNGGLTSLSTTVSLTNSSIPIVINIQKPFVRPPK